MDKFVIQRSFSGSGTMPASSDSDTSLPTVTAEIPETQLPCSAQSLASIFSTPTDLAKLGEPIKQIKLERYPKDTHNRSFQVGWYNHFPWLEYSEEINAAFCYACRLFCPFGSKESTFTETGFRNWKNAMDKSGFRKHESSARHIIAMSMWEEQKKHVSRNVSVSTLLNESVLEKNRYYVRSMAEVVQFLVVNELAFRGTYSVDEETEDALFRNLFQYTLRKDAKLAECCSVVPKNVTYTSPEIQNEILEIMSEMVREDVVKEIKTADVPAFTLLENGTRDKNNRENIAIGIRFVRNGTIKESLLDIQTATKLDAVSFTNLTLKILEDNDLDSQLLLSQCYDGASVMSGKTGGVQALLQNSIGKSIPYVHWFNHQLHLVVVKTVSEIHEVCNFFDQCSMLCEFLQHTKVAELYEGQKLVRLLEYRWHGHFAVTKIIMNNFSEIVKALQNVKNKDLNGSDIATSFGLLSVIKSLEFRFCVVLMKTVLSIIDPADKVLQRHDTSLKDAMVIIQSVKNRLCNLRSVDSFESLVKEADKFLLDSKRDSETKPAMKRQRKNVTTNDFVMTDSIPGHSSETSQNFLKRIFYETIDIIISELQSRFEKNSELMEAIGSVYDFDLEKMKYFSSLGISLPPKEELLVVKDYLLRQNIVGSENMFQEIFKQCVAFKSTYELLAFVNTFGCSTAMCESTFSVTNLNRPQRLFVTHKRLANLAYLAFEKKRTQNIDFDYFLCKFNDKQNRKLQLY